MGKIRNFLLNSTSVSAGAIIGETLLLLANQDSAHQNRKDYLENHQNYLPQVK